MVRERKNGGIDNSNPQIYTPNEIVPQMRNYGYEIYDEEEFEEIEQKQLHPHPMDEGEC